jgi:hypothetical protein
MWTLRQLSMSTAAKLAAGEDPMVEASVVKELGNAFEQDMPRRVQAILDCDWNGRKRSRPASSRPAHRIAQLLAARRHARSDPRDHRTRIGTAMSAARDMLCDTARAVFTGASEIDPVKKLALGFCSFRKIGDGFGGDWGDRMPYCTLRASRRPTCRSPI